MSSPERAPVSRGATTQRGAATRQRILDTACDLVFERGAMALSLDEILAATGASKSQLYHYFADKSDLIHSVVERQGERVLDQHRPVIAAIDGWEALRQWRDFVVSAVTALNCRGGCPVGSLADELAEVDERARTQAASIFAQWQGLLEDALRAMVAAEQLRPDADVGRLSLATMASLQGGLLLAKTTRTTTPVEVALDAAIAYLQTFALDSTGRRRGAARRGR